MNINRNNYEEYFILYLDNELPEDLRAEVEGFAEANPDLKAELDLLLQTRLLPEEVSFPGKTSLLRITASDGINHQNAEHHFLLYLDNELSPGERQAVENFLDTNPEFKQEFSLLSRTRLQEEHISFPDKATLYRKEERAAVIRIKWWRLAAAAVLFLGILGAGINYINNASGHTQDPSLATVSSPGKPAVKAPATDEPIAPGEKKIPSRDDEASKLDLASEIPSKELSTDPALKRATALRGNAGKDSKDEKAPSNNLPNPTEENPYVFNKSRIAVNGDDMAEVDLRLPSRKTLTNLPEISADPVVTPTSLQPLYTSNTSDKEDNDVRQKGKGGGFRGFVRKITRTFEKNTNIETTDGDDRLLVAGLAIKL